MIRVVVYLDHDERRALKLAAVDREQSASEIVREALRAFLKVKEQMRPGGGEGNHAVPCGAVGQG